MATTTPELISAGKLIQNSPYLEPTKFWRFDPMTRRWELEPGRRPAGFLAQGGSGDFDDPGAYHPIKIANDVRDRVRKWREGGYAGVTGVTKRLLDHWRDPEQRRPDRRLFFCQLE